MTDPLIYEKMQREWQEYFIREFEGLLRVKENRNHADAMKTGKDGPEMED